ncbi:MAG: PhoH family protein [Elusimicrobiales bacterium]|nr:PhoH family protein [Elusimicrobiales bacterium]
MVTKKLRLETGGEALKVLGVQDRRLRQLERELRVAIFVRHDPEGEGVALSVRGSVSRVDKALAKIRALLAESAQAGAAPVSGESRAEANGWRQEEISALRPRASCKNSKNTPVGGILYRPEHAAPVGPRSARQQEYVSAIFDHDLTVAVGPAGTGKTFLAVAAALRALELNLVDRIILTRPIVEAGEKLGFLPGDLYEKVHPYLRPLYDAFYAMLGPERMRAWRADNIVEIVPLAYMRGRTLENAFIILDEAQNTVPEQMKMFLTRMGLNSKMVITGDITQIDLKEKAQSGLVHAMSVLKKTPAVKFIAFQHEDVVRHPLVKDIVLAYETYEGKGQKQ